MSAKLIQVSRDGITWNTLTGNDAGIDINGAEIENTTFGSDFTSAITGIIEHSLSANSMFRNTAGFQARLKKAEDSTPFTAESMSLEGDWYVIDDRDLSIWDLSEGVTILDDALPIDDGDIASIDYLNGRVRLVSGYVPEGAITVTGSYLTTTTFACARSIDLSQTMDTIETGCFETVGENGGFEFYEGTLRSVGLDIDRFYRDTVDFYELLKDREDFILEIDLDNTGTTVARGQFKVLTDALTGGVGGDESESVTFSLSVPTTNIPVVPFSWYFDEDSQAPEGFKDVIWAWETKQPLKTRYLPKGVGEKGFQGDYIVTDASLSIALDTLPELSVSGQGTGALARINA